MGQAFCELGFAIKEEKPIFVKIGMNFENVSKLGHAHNIKEWKPVQELFIEYKGLVDSWRKLMGKIQTFSDFNKTIESNICVHILDLCV